MEKFRRKFLICCCGALCAALLAFVFSVGTEPGVIPETENLRVRVMDDCEIYELQCVRDNASGGVVNADGSALQKGTVLTWEIKTGIRTVTLAALDQEGYVAFETTVTHDFGQSTCTLLLTADGFVEEKSF